MVMRKLIFEEHMAKTEAIDRIVEKMISRKMLVWLTATGALLFGTLDSDNWVQVSMVYIGSQAALDVVTGYLRAKRSDS